MIVTSQTSSNPGFNLDKIRSRINYSLDPFGKISEPVITGFTVLPFNFYHFMTDLVLPYLASDEKNRKIFLPFNPTPSQVQILNFLKIEYINAKFQANHIFSDAKILPSIFVERNFGWKMKRNPYCNYNFNSQVLHDAREAILGMLPLQSSRNSEKIFLSRRGATRSPENILEIEEVFRHHGFIIFNADDFDFQQTIRFFHGAGVVVGIHGAALTNMIFAKPGCQVIELDPVSHKMGGDIRPVFELMAQKLGFNYKKMDIPSSRDGWVELASTFHKHEN